MSWKKNAFSCVMWLLYLLMVGAAMLFMGRVICVSLGMADILWIVIPAACLLVTGIVVFLLHRMAVELDAGFRNMGRSLIWIERILVVVLFAAGLFLRVIEMRPDRYAVSGESAYLDLAYISADGQGISPFSQGADWLYVRVLRLCFLLLGNKAVVAVWLQILLQLSGVMLLYFAVRKMAGRLPAVVMAFFFMLSPYMIRKSLTFSPEMLYLFLFSLVLLFVSWGVENVFGWGFWFLAGGMTAVLGYLNVAGFLLLPMLPGVIATRRQNAERKLIRGLLGCLTGLLLGAAGCLFANALDSGKPVSQIMQVWVEMYRWKGLQLSVAFSSFDIIILILLILSLLAWGIFSFWCDRKVERFSVWILCLGIAALLQCMGMFTEEMNGSVFIFFFSTVLAGLGIRESMAVCQQETEEEKGRMEIKGRTEIQNRTETQGRTETQDRAETQGRIETQGRTETQDRTETRDRTEPNDRTETKDKTEIKDRTEEKNRTESKDDTENRDHTGGKALETGEQKAETGDQPEKRKIEFLENPLPLPKKHVKRVMDYKLDPGKDLGGYDVYVADDDDFDH